MNPAGTRIAAGAVLLALAAGAVAGYAAGGQSGLLLVLAGGQLVLTAVALAAWRDLRRAHRRLRGDLRAVGARVSEGTDGLRGALDDTGTRLARTVRAELDRHGRRSGQRAAEQLQTALQRQFQQIEALGALYYQLRPARGIPPTRSWVASPDLLRYLYETVRDGRQRLVVECGSGVSTLVFGYALRARGGGRVVALEHDPQYAEITQQLLAGHDLAEWAEVRVAPLKPVTLEGESWPWYDLPAVPPGPIDLLLVDGPPGATRDRARFPAVPLLYDRLAAGAAVVLDDYDRDDERAIGRRWQELFPQLVPERPRHEKGTLVLRRPPA